jgi:hypothetical protein
LRISGFIFEDGMDKNEENLRWLVDQLFQEISTLRDTEERLFTWASSTMFATLGVLTGLRGLSNGAWSLTWRFILWFGVVAGMGAVLHQAYLLYNRAVGHRREAVELLQTIDPILAQAPRAQPVDSLFFFLRWGSIALMGAGILALIYLLG